MEFSLSKKTIHKWGKYSPWLWKAPWPICFIHVVLLMWQPWPALFPRSSLRDGWDRMRGWEDGDQKVIKTWWTTWFFYAASAYETLWNYDISEFLRFFKFKSTANLETNAEIQDTKTLTLLLRFALLQMSRALTVLLASFVSSSTFFFQLLSVAASFAAQPVDTWDYWWAHKSHKQHWKISKAKHRKCQKLGISPYSDWMWLTAQKNRTQMNRMVSPIAHCPWRLWQCLHRGCHSGAGICLTRKMSW